MVEKIDPSHYGRKIEELVAFEKINALGPGTPDQDFFPRLSKFDFSQTFAIPAANEHSYAEACLAALWLRHDFLDQSHTISQGILNTTGSYWHGIMHRREGDYWNSKYWFRRVGDHPIFADLLKSVIILIQDSDHSGHLVTKNQTQWDPFRFIDSVEEVSGTHSGLEILCKKIQRLEWLILFDYSFRMASGGPLESKPGIAKG